MTVDQTTKFGVSIAVSLTAPGSFGYVRPDRRSMEHASHRSRPAAAGSFEIFYIAWQVGHGLASHFNKSSVFYEVMYALMGLGAVSMVATTPLLHGRFGVALFPGFIRHAAVTGLVLCFVLGGGFGIYMSQQPGHAVEFFIGGRAPIFGWNRAGGDLRIAHSLGSTPSRQYLFGWLLAAHHAIPAAR